jgi:hypothetical protein
MARFCFFSLPLETGGVTDATMETGLVISKISSIAPLVNRQCHYSDVFFMSIYGINLRSHDWLLGRSPMQTVTILLRRKIQ